MNEREWWDRFGHLNDKIWEYDKFLQTSVRQQYLDDMELQLFKPDGYLLDFGCGTGSFSLPFARKGMNVLGIDTSYEQISKAKRKAEEMGIGNVLFVCGDKVPSQLMGTFDSILLHAFFHHLPNDSREEFLRYIIKALRPGGKLYLYEPILAETQPPFYARLVDVIIGGIFKLLHIFANIFDMYESEFKEARKLGWSMKSPDESPIQLSEIVSSFPEYMRIEVIKTWHIWSIAYANHCMQLQKKWKALFSKLAPLFYYVDSNIRNKRWVKFLHAWIMVSILAVKNE
jgi:SAM-dependent methyltransferase